VQLKCDANTFGGWKLVPNSFDLRLSVCVFFKIISFLSFWSLFCRYSEIKGQKKSYMYSDTFNIEHLEAYLTDEEFFSVFQLDKKSFYGKPKWRQAELLKKANLF
jgi:hypothetical protein